MAAAAPTRQPRSRRWRGSGAARRCRSLREVAAALGADVPFFLSGGTALGLGRGEEIYPLVDLPPHWVVIVRPPFGVSTAEAYAWYDEDRAAGLREPRELQILPVPWPTRAAQMINDLEPPVVRRHPEIGALRTALRDAGAVAAAMSGSGSAVFGLFRSRAARAGRSGRYRAAVRGAADAHAEPGRVRAARSRNLAPDVIGAPTRPGLPRLSRETGRACVPGERSAAPGPSVVAAVVQSWSSVPVVQSWSMTCRSGELTGPSATVYT